MSPDLTKAGADPGRRSKLHPGMVGGWRPVRAAHGFGMDGMLSTTRPRVPIRTPFPDPLSRASPAASDGLASAWPWLSWAAEEGEPAAERKMTDLGQVPHCRTDSYTPGSECTALHPCHSPSRLKTSPILACSCRPEKAPTQPSTATAATTTDLAISSLASPQGTPGC